MKNKIVLDATCGSKMMWFDKNNDIALFVDKREVDNELIWASKDGKESCYLTVKPDIIADFTSLPFDDNTFYHVLFDPPHLVNISENAWLCKKYGRLDKNSWREILHDGFAECYRVLKPNGTLIFKWCETDITVKQVVDAIGVKPLYGSRSGKNMRTHWMAFVKE